MANQYKDVQMLNPYKFATYQFMKQYFSVSPRMYMDFGTLDSNAVPSTREDWIPIDQRSGTNYYQFVHTSYSYNDILKMIEPFEPQFGLDEYGLPNNEPYNYDHIISRNEGNEYINNWSKCMLPMVSVCGVNDNNWGDGRAEPPLPGGASSFANTTLYNNYANKPSKCFYISTTHEELTYYFEDTNHNHVGYHKTPNQSYHGQIFAAFIPIYTINKVRRHREFIKIHYSQSKHGLIANENFFSTTTRNGFFQDGGVSFTLHNNYPVNFECDLNNTSLWQTGWNGQTYTGHRELTKSNLILGTNSVVNITAEYLPSKKTNLSGWGAVVSPDIQSCVGYSAFHSIYKYLTSDDSNPCQYPDGISLSEQQLILGRINGNV